MAKHVKETLGQFQDWKYFSLLEEKFEEKSEEKSGDPEDKKIKDEEAKDGMDAIKKLRDNLSRFETASGGKILKYKEFWEENQEATDAFDEEGNLYKLWDSDYIAGVLDLPDEALSDEELNTEIEDVDAESSDEDAEEEDDKDEEETDDDEEDEDEEDEDEEDEDEEDEDEEKDEDNELEEGNAFSGALKKARDAGKKDFKFKGKTYPVKEWDMPLGQDFLFEEEEEDDEDEELNGGPGASDEPLTPPDEESEEEEQETEDEFAGFSEPGEGEEELEVEVEDGEAIELDGDLDGDGEEEGGMEFAGEEGINTYFVIYNVAGSEREEVFRTDDPKVIEEFKNFFENEWKAAIRDQIQTFKQAKEEKRNEEERKAKEELRKERKAKLDKFMKESFINEYFDDDPYDESFVLDKDPNKNAAYEEEPDMYANRDIEPNEEFYDEDDVDDVDDGEFYDWQNDLIDILSTEYDLDLETAEMLVDRENLEEAYESGLEIEQIADGIYNEYSG